MPKRKRDNSSQSNYEYLTKKLKKLERKIVRCQNNEILKGDSDQPSSDSDKPSLHNRLESESIAIIDNGLVPETSEEVPGCSYWTTGCRYDDVLERDEYDSDVSAELVTNTLAPQLAPPLAALQGAPAQLPSVVVVPTPPAPATATPPQPSPQLINAAVSLNAAQLLPTTTIPPAAPQHACDVSELDPELMDILGEDPTCAKDYGKDIQKDLAVRLNHIVTSGLSKEIRKELKDKYLIPANCKLIKAPTLNPEIQASLIESQAKRDKGIENKQTLTSCALSSLSEALTLLLSSDNKNPELLKLLMDTARMLGDLQHADSISRRLFILSTVNKQVKDQLGKTKIDEMLFGSNLVETLKSAKTINKSGAELRSVSTIKPIVLKPAKANSRPLNYRAPPASRRPPQQGGARNTRAPQPTPRPTMNMSTQPNVFRGSLRHPPTRYRR